MNGWAGSLAWFSLYITSLIIVPKRKLGRGLFTRHILARVVPPRSCWRGGQQTHTYRYFIWLSVCQIITWVWNLNKVWNLLFWSVIILMLLDDYFFGDDNSWKRFKEWAGNKVKWKMELPPQPVGARDGTG